MVLGLLCLLWALPALACASPAETARRPVDSRGGATAGNATDLSLQGPPAAGTVTSRPEADAAASTRAPARTSTTPPAPLDSVVADHAIVATATTVEVVVHANPSPLSIETLRLANPTASGAPLVLLVVDREGDWLKVSLPIRPNGATGWIPIDSVTLSRNRFRIEVDTSDHRMLVFDSGRPIVDTPVAIGTGSTPTPLGSFYLIELLAPLDPAGIYGPYAFGLSGYSETLSSFNGGEGVIGIHGTNDPSSIGRDVSHGCIRVPNDIISDMATYLPLGTPVVISA